MYHPLDNCADFKQKVKSLVKAGLAYDHITRNKLAD